ncbi:MAG: aspartate kinase [Lachnospiraceae bacterium]|nr:aspartate kinase [Candidatus Minthocola equi]
MLKVTKFGGSSVAGPEQFKKVKNIICDDESRKVVIVSAGGKRYADDHKLTDLLYLCQAHLEYGVSCDDILDTINERFSLVTKSLSLSCNITDELAEFRASLSKDSSRDYIVSRGEYFTAKMMADYLGYTFVDAKDCIFFSFDGTIDKEKTYAAISDAYGTYGKIVIPGFYGSLPNGKIKVMARGGSDITGSLAAAALNADAYENWTDVSGILMADPRIVESPKPIPMMTYAELCALAISGASVLQEDSVAPVRDAGIPLVIKNTNFPEDPGTVIVEKIESEGADQDRFITGIAGRKNFTVISVQKHSMNVTENLKIALDILGKYHVNAEHITLGFDSYSITVSSAAIENCIFDCIADIQKKCVPDKVDTQDGLALVAAVGRKMTFRPGISGRLFNALGESGVNIKTIAQGADELSITVGVDNKDFDTTVRVLYNGFAG